jgi:hypothetical protein
MQKRSQKPIIADVLILIIKVFYLIFFFIVNREAIADNMRQAHVAAGGTSGVIAAIISAALAIGANVPDPSGAFIA